MLIFLPLVSLLGTSRYSRVWEFMVCNPDPRAFLLSKDTALVLGAPTFVIVNACFLVLILVA